MYSIYSLVVVLHLVALVAFGGMTLLTDLRLLGVGMRRYSVSEVLNGLRLPKRFAFIAAAITGATLFTLKAELHSGNAWFWVKMLLLALVGVNHLIFRRGVYRSPQLTAGISLLLWTGVVCAGRGPATIKDIMHSMVDPNGDAVFKSVQEISDEHGIREKAPHTDAEWLDVRGHLMVLREAPDLLTKPGRLAARARDRSKSPAVEEQPEEVQRLIDSDRPLFIRRARRLHDAAALAIAAVDAKDSKALLRAIDGIDKACENCHLYYWYPRDARARQAAKEDGITE